MKKNYIFNLSPKKYLLFAVLLTFLCRVQVFSQTTVYTNNFTNATNSTTASGTTLTINSLDYKVFTTATSGTTLPTLGVLASPVNTLQVSANTSARGTSFLSAALSGFASPFNATLGSNNGIITWSFNMRNNRSAVFSNTISNCFTTANGGSSGGALSAGVVIATNNSNASNISSTSSNTSSGWAVILTGNTGSTANQLHLGYFTNGLTNAGFVPVISSGDIAPQRYLSIIVSYNPSSNLWSFSYRDDGTTAFTNPLPKTGYTDATATNNNVTATAMTNTMFYYNHNGTNATVWDNFSVVVSESINSPSVTSLTGFTYAVGAGPSAEQSFTVSAPNLSDNLVITAPADYELSTVSGGTFSNSITIDKTTAIASNTIYVRLKAGLSAANYNNEDITLTSTNAPSKKVTCSGNVTASATPFVTLSATSLASSFAKTTAGTNSISSQSFTVFGNFLGTNDIVITPPTNFKISLTDVDVNYSSSPINLTPISGSVPTTTIYVKYSPTGTGNVSGNTENIAITCAASGISTQNVSATGNGLSTFYYNSGTFNSTSSWTALSNGTGDNPTDFSSTSISYTILKSVTTDAPLTVSGASSKIVVGATTVSGVTLTIASGFAITGTVDITAASSGSNSVVLQDATTQPTFGTLHSTSEVHYQVTSTSLGLTATYGKLFFEGNGATSTTFSTGNATSATSAIIQTSLTISSLATVSVASTGASYFYLNTGATATINGSFKTSRPAGFVAFNKSSPDVGTSTGAAIQFKDVEIAGTSLVLTGSSIEFNRGNSGTVQTVTPRTDYNNLTISDGSTAANNKTLSGTTIVAGTFTLNHANGSALTLSGTLTANAVILTKGTLTGSGNLTLANGATITKTEGNFDATPSFGTTVNVIYNGTTAVTGTSYPIPASLSSLNNLTISNAAGVTLSSDVTVNGILTLTSGTLSMASGKMLSISATGSVVRTLGSLATAPTYSTATAVTLTNAIGITSGYELLPISGNIGTLGLNSNSTYTLSSSVNVASLSIAGSSTLTDGGFNVTVAGNVSGTGTYTGTGKIIMTGSGKTINGLRISNIDLTGSGITTLAGSPTITGQLNVTNGTLATSTNTITLDASTGSAIFSPTSILSIASGGAVEFNSRPVILQSSSAGTASISTIAGTLSNASNVTVERYIPSNTRRRYVLVGSPAAGASIYNAWQEGGAVNAGYGTLITGGAAGGTNGFDLPTSSAKSIFTYNDDNATGSKWVGLANTNATNLSSGAGYLLFVRGDRTLNLATTPTASGNTTLRATGTIGQGDISPALLSGANKYTLIANPYPCAIDWNSGSITKTNLTGNFTVYDANNNVFVSSNGTVKTPNVGNQQVGYIQSGQAFFVQNDGTGNGAVTFTEAAKTTSATTTSSTTVFGEAASKAQLNINVYRTADKSFADGVVALFGNNYKTSVDTKEDIYKFTNLNETFGLRRNNIVLGLEARPLVQSTDTMYFSLSNFAKKAYSLVIDGSNFNATTAKLEDKFTGTSTVIDVSGTTIYNFNVTDDAATSSNDRFSITFGSTVASTVVTDGAAASSLYVKMSPNPVLNQLQVSFKTATAEATIINVVNSLGQVVKTVNAGNVANGNVSVPVAELANGVYSVQLLSGNKVIHTQRIVKSVN